MQKIKRLLSTDQNKLFRARIVRIIDQIEKKNKVDWDSVEDINERIWRGGFKSSEPFCECLREFLDPKKPSHAYIAIGVLDTAVKENPEFFWEILITPIWLDILEKLIRNQIDGALTTRTMALLMQWDTECGFDNSPFMRLFLKMQRHTGLSFEELQNVTYSLGPSPNRDLSSQPITNSSEELQEEPLLEETYPILPIESGEDDIERILKLSLEEEQMKQAERERKQQQDLERIIRESRQDFRTSTNTTSVHPKQELSEDDLIRIAIEQSKNESKKSKSNETDEEEQLRKALESSRRQYLAQQEQEEELLRMALEQSKSQNNNNKSKSELEEHEKYLLKVALEQSKIPKKNSNERDDDFDLALKKSLEDSSKPIQTYSPAELEKIKKKSQQDEEARRVRLAQLEYENEENLKNALRISAEFYEIEQRLQKQWENEVSPEQLKQQSADSLAIANLKKLIQTTLTVVPSREDGNRRDGKLRMNLLNAISRIEELENSKSGEVTSLQEQMLLNDILSTMSQTPRQPFPQKMDDFTKTKSIRVVNELNTQFAVPKSVLGQSIDTSMIKKVDKSQLTGKMDSLLITAKMTEVSNDMIVQTANAVTTPLTQTPVSGISSNSINPQSSPPPPPLFGGVPPVPPPLLYGTVRKRGIDGVGRAPQVIALYQEVKRRMRDIKANAAESSNGGSGGTSGLGGGDSGSHNRVAQQLLEQSPYAKQVEKDIIEFGPKIISLSKRVIEFQATNITQVVAFVETLDVELSVLSDEVAVLKRFEEWPVNKVDTLRECVGQYAEIQATLTSLENIKQQALSHSNAYTDETFKTIEMTTTKARQSHDRINVSCKDDEKKYSHYSIPFELNLYLDKVKSKVTELATVYLLNTIAAVESMKTKKKDRFFDPEKKTQFLLTKALRFVFQIHQFAGGLEEQGAKAFEKLKIMIDERMENLDPNAVVV